MYRDRFNAWMHGFPPFHFTPLRFEFRFVFLSKFPLCGSFCLQKKFNIFRARTASRPYILLISARCVCLYLLADYGRTRTSLSHIHVTGSHPYGSICLSAILHMPCRIERAEYDVDGGGYKIVLLTSFQTKRFDFFGCFHIRIVYLKKINSLASFASSRISTSFVLFHIFILGFSSF